MDLRKYILSRALKVLFGLAFTFASIICMLILGGTVILASTFIALNRRQSVLGTDNDIVLVLCHRQRVFPCLTLLPEHM